MTGASAITLAAAGFPVAVFTHKVAESGMFTQVKEQSNIVKGNFLMFFTNASGLKSMCWLFYWIAHLVCYRHSC